MKHTFLTLSLATVLAFTAAGHAQTAKQSKAENLSSKQLIALSSAAKTPAEHQRIADYYQAKSQDLLAQSNEHAQMAQAYRNNPVTNSSKAERGTVDHCTYLAVSLKARSVKMQELAQAHEQMAKDAGQK
jgi:hypothetical protein